jgi:hypothetical protein
MSLRGSVPRAFLRVFGHSIAQRSSRAAIHALRPTPAVGDDITKPKVSSADDGSNAATLNFATKKELDELPHGLSVVMTCFNNNMMMVHAAMMRLDAKIDSINLCQKQIEARVDQIEANAKGVEVNHDRIKANSDRIEWNFDRIERMVEVDRSEVCDFRSEQQAAISRIYRMLDQIRYGLGFCFEGFNLAWLQRVLAARVYPDANVERRVTLPDPDRTVHAKSSHVEVDIYCKHPLLIAEATTFLGKREFEKLEKFAKVGALKARILRCSSARTACTVLFAVR